jgi:hypothetical protein
VRARFCRRVRLDMMVKVLRPGWVGLRQLLRTQRIYVRWCEEDEREGEGWFVSEMKGEEKVLW